MSGETHVKRAYRISELVNAFGVGRTTIYALIANGQLEAMKQGKITMISASSVNAWEGTCRAEAKAVRKPVAANKGSRG